MKKYCRCLSIAFLYCTFIASIATGGGIEFLSKNSETISQFPVYEEGESVTEFSLNNGTIRGVTYEVTIPYPAEDVIKFYKKSMENRGYFELDSSSPKIWERFVDDTKEGSPYITQYIEDWVDKEKKKRVRLVLIYSTSSATGGKTNFADWISLNVRIQSMPY
jgi:hypothetical protein